MTALPGVAEPPPPMRIARPRGRIPVRAGTGAQYLLRLAPLAALAANLAVGVLLGLRTLWPAARAPLPPMAVLQPLHGALAIGWVMAAGLSVLLLALHRVRGIRAPVLRGFTLAEIAFLAALAASIATGHGSGAEYLAWGMAVSVLPLALYTAALVLTVRRYAALVAWSPEATWLILLGLTLAPLGIVEHHAGVLGLRDYTRALTLEWHALDTAFAGGNALLYGLGILAAAPPGRARPLRSRRLYLIAAFAFLSTFGHHHYASPQPHLLKVTALLASLLAGVSFVRHVRAARKIGAHMSGPAAPFLAAAEWWTLFAIGSGFLLALPHVNHYLHGTYAIVAHAMGATIGVNTMLAMGGMVAFAGGGSEQGHRRAVRAVSLVAAGLVLTLLVAGVIEGVLRPGRTYWEFRPVVRAALLPLAVLGPALLLTLGRLTGQLARRQ